MDLQLFQFFARYSVTNRIELPHYHFRELSETVWVCLMDFHYKKVSQKGSTKLLSKLAVAQQMLVELPPHFMSMYKAFREASMKPISLFGKSRNKLMIEALSEYKAICEKAILGRLTYYLTYDDDFVGLCGNTQPDELAAIENDALAMEDTNDVQAEQMQAIRMHSAGIKRMPHALSETLESDDANKFEILFIRSIKSNSIPKIKLEKFCRVLEYPRPFMKILQFKIGDDVLYQAECYVGGYACFNIDTTKWNATKSVVYTMSTFLMEQSRYSAVEA